MVSKLLSGRYLLTVACAFVFVWSAVNKLLSPAETVAILMFVFQAYFHKHDEQKKEDLKQ